MKVYFVISNNIIIILSVQNIRRRHVKPGFLSLETIETWIVSVVHSEGEWARETIEVPLNEVW